MQKKNEGALDRVLRVIVGVWVMSPPVRRPRIETSRYRLCFALPARRSGARA